METKLFFSIDFIILKCNHDKKRAGIYARITVNGDRKESAIKEQIAYADWDNSSECVKAKSIAVKTMNLTIDNTRFRIKEKYRELEDREELITEENVKNAYIGQQFSQRGHTLTESFNYYKKIWEAKLKKGDLRIIKQWQR